MSPRGKRIRNVQDALSAFARTESLTGEEQWFCERCATHVDATKHISVWRTPPVLVIHLMRFKSLAYVCSRVVACVTLLADAPPLPLSQRWETEQNDVQGHVPPRRPAST